MSERFTIRRATPDDIGVLVELRDAMLSEAAEDGVLRDVSEALGNTREYFEEKLPAGEYVCFLAEVEGQVVGVGGMVLFRKPTLPQSPLGLEGYILNMLTLAEFSRKGIASAIMREMLASAREAGAGLVALKATDAGRRVYEKFGFTENPHYMQLKL